MERKFALLAIVLMTFSIVEICAQNNKARSEGERFFGIRAYDSALPKFLEAVEAGDKDPMLHYKIGVCYHKSLNSNDQLKAIPYYEYALSKGEGLPLSVHY